MNLFGHDRTAELEVIFTVDAPPQRVYQLLREEAGTGERVTDAIDESPSGAPGTVWRLRVQAGGSRRWIRSRVVVDEPPFRLDITCASVAPYLRRFETACSYVLRPGADGGTIVVLTVQTPVGAGNRFIRPRSEAQLRELLEIEAKRWAARVSGDDSVPAPETTVRVYGKLVPLTLFGVVALAFFAAGVTRSYLVLPAGAVVGWIALLFAMRHSSSDVARPAVRPRAPRVRTIRQVRLRPRPDAGNLGRLRSRDRAQCPPLAERRDGMCVRVRRSVAWRSDDQQLPSPACGDFSAVGRQATLLLVVVTDLSE